MIRRVLAFLLLAVSVRAAEPAVEAKSLDFDALLRHSLHPGDSARALAWKQAADDELYARGGTTLSNLMNLIHIENVFIGVKAMYMVKDKPLPAEQAVPALIPFLESPRWQTRKMAAFFLGFYPDPGLADKLFPLFDDEKTCGAAVRTLGKWHVTNAVPRIEQCFTNRRDRIRAVSANALRDIGDPRAIPALIAALGDPVFGVRNNAARALVSFKAAAVEPLLSALETNTVPAARRQIVRALGDLGDERAIRPLQKMASSAETGLREDVARSLAYLRKERTDPWFGPGGD